MSNNVQQHCTLYNANPDKTEPNKQVTVIFLGGAYDDEEGQCAVSSTRLISHQSRGKKGGGVNQG